MHATERANFPLALCSINVLSDKTDKNLKRLKLHKVRMETFEKLLFPPDLTVRILIFSGGHATLQ